MRVLTALALSGMLMGCAGQQSGEHTPQLQVDQDGLAERMTMSAPRQDSEGAQSDEPTEAAPETEPNQESEVSHSSPPDHPEKPSAARSGDRVSLRTVGPEKMTRPATAPPAPPAPDQGSLAERDGRNLAAKTRSRALRK